MEFISLGESLKNRLSCVVVGCTYEAPHLLKLSICYSFSIRSHFDQ